MVCSAGPKLKNLWSNHVPRTRADCYLIRFWDPHGSVKQIHHEELEERDKERASAFSKIMLKQTDSGIQQLHGAGERTQGSIIAFLLTLFINS